MPCHPLRTGLVVTSLALSAVVNSKTTFPELRKAQEWVEIGEIYGGKASSKNATRAEFKSGDIAVGSAKFFRTVLHDIERASKGEFGFAFGDSMGITVAARRGHLWEARDYLKKGAQKWHLDVKLYRLSKDLPETTIEAK